MSLGFVNNIRLAIDGHVVGESVLFRVAYAGSTKYIDRNKHISETCTHATFEMIFSCGLLNDAHEINTSK